MHMFKLTKSVELYKTQFDSFNVRLTGGYELDRTSLELDNMLFRTKYMVRKGYEVPKSIGTEFTKKSIRLQQLFGEFIHNFLTQIITIPDPFHLEDIHDVLTKDVKINSNYVSFVMILISPNKEYLKYVDESIPDSGTFDMFPNEYFRFQTDSYNDAIAKAFPELFDNKRQDIIGVGADADVFVHNLTFQTTERCSLNCFPAGTNILMADFSSKDISEIKIGDEILGFEEFNEFGKQRNLLKSTVNATSYHYESLYKITHPSIRDVYVTPEHPFWTGRGNWVAAKDISPSDGLMITSFDPDDFIDTNVNSIDYIKGYFIAGFLGDGFVSSRKYVNKKTGKTYYGQRLRFAVKDEEMNSRMWNYSYTLGFDFNIYNFKISEKYNLYVKALSSSRQSERDKWDAIYNNYFTDKAPIISNMTTEFIMGFMAGFYDAEGHIDGTCIRMFNSDTRYLKVIERGLDILRIKFDYDKPKPGVNKTVQTLRLLGGSSSAIKFIKSIKNAIVRKGIINFIGKSLFHRIDGYKIEYIRDARKVYNFETECHTYIANRVMVHNCTYCFSGETQILMADGSYKRIDEIFVGDTVAGFYEKFSVNKTKADIPAEVTAVFHRRAKVVKLSHKWILDTYVTPNHKVATSNGGCRAKWLSIDEIKPDTNPLFRVKGTSRDMSEVYCYEKEYVNEEMDVYNIETSTHTYVANNLAVHNCYQFNKTPMRMEFETAKNFIDHLLNDDYGYINRYNSPAIIIEFIGGEPLLEINLTRRIYEYFLDRCYELNHPWFSMHRVSICSNGLQYFDEDVQSFFRDYSHNISFNISIDGNKELHDSCRIQPNGEGSYDIAIAALNHFNAHYTSERNSKMTLAPSNIKYLFESVKDFIFNDMTCININCVFEEGWNRETARTEYEQLKLLADWLIENDLEHIYIAIFTDRQEGVMDPDNDGSYCGGVGSMTAIRPNGQIYPCIRYMPTSVGNDVPDLCMGTVDDGWNERKDGSEVIKILDSVTRRLSSTDICFSCPISNNCPNCSALSHAVYGTPNKRTTFHCIQHIAEALANVYYWNKLRIAKPELNIPIRHNVVPDRWALLVIDRDELSILKDLENN